MKLAALAICSIVALSGCANQNYAKYATAQENIATARYQALQAAAEGGSDTTKVAVAMAIALGGNAPGGNNMVAPRDPGDVALGWASVLVPGLTQVYGINKNAQIAITQSNNSKDVQINTNQTMQGLGALNQGIVTGTPGMQMLYPEPAANRVVIVPSGSTSVTVPQGAPAGAAQ